MGGVAQELRDIIYGRPLIWDIIHEWHDERNNTIQYFTYFE